MYKDSSCSSVVWYVILILLLNANLQLQAAQPYTPKFVNQLAEPWRWKHFPELEGKGIRYIAETPDKKVWVSYNKGVLEYDGYTWTEHDLTEDREPRPTEELLVTEDSMIYAATTDGIFRYDGNSWEPFFSAPEDYSFTFYRLKQLSDQSIVACSDGGVIQFFPDGKTLFYTSPERAAELREQLQDISWIILPEEALDDTGEDFHHISDVLEEENGQLYWFAVTTEAEEGKLLRFRPQDVQNHRIVNYEVIVGDDHLQLGEEQQLLKAQDGRIWVINSSSNRGLGIYDGEKWEVIQLSQRFGGDDYMSDIIQLSDGSIWISSMAKIFSYSQGNWHMYKAPHFPVPANRIMLQKGRSDQIWVAGYKSKVLQLDFSPNQWMSYADLNFQCETDAGDQWFLEVNNRIVHRRRDSWISYGVEDGLMDSPIRLIETSKGQIWVAGSHQGVAATAVLRPDGWERHLHRELSWGIDYRSVFESEDGTLWFGGSVDADLVRGFRSGLLQLPNPTEYPLQWQHHEFGDNGLNQANVYGIAQSTDGRIWIGGSRLMNYDGHRWTAHPDERLQQYVNVVCSTDELLLVGSRYYGLFVYDGKTWTNYNTSNGLSGNTVISIDALSKDYILVATENDICRFDGCSWTTNVFPEKLNMDFEGGTLLHTAENTIWINHAPRSWKRRVYQNTNDQQEEGEFFTVRYKPTSDHPETEINISLETVSQEGNSLISWSGKDYFAQTPDNDLAYSYRLDDEEWSEFKKEQQYTFTSLSSGEHTLQVRARDLDFNIDPTPATVTFRVLPPIWKQGWFILLILTFLTIYGIYEYRVISKKQKLEILNASLHEANLILKEKGQQIECQNREILAQQEQILDQAKVLEDKNTDLEERNAEIRSQRDQLEEMVAQVENLSKAKLAFLPISHTSCARR